MDPKVNVTPAPVTLELATSAAIIFLLDHEVKRHPSSQSSTDAAKLLKDFRAVSTPKNMLPQPGDKFVSVMRLQRAYHRGDGYLVVSGTKPMTLPLPITYSILTRDTKSKTFDFKVTEVRGDMFLGSVIGNDADMDIGSFVVPGPVQAGTLFVPPYSNVDPALVSSPRVPIATVDPRDRDLGEDFGAVGPGIEADLLR